MTAEYRAYLAHKENRPPDFSEEFLAHYGVKGQKWGVRNYQYADGGYTPAGAERYWGGTGQRRQGIVSTQQRSVPRASNGGINPNTGRRTRPGTMYARTWSSSIRGIQNGKRRLTQQQAARRAKVKKALAIGAGVAVAAALGYAAYKGSTNLRDHQRADVHKNFNTDWRNVNTLNSKYWDSSDRARFAEVSRQRANDVASGITRRDAVASRFYEKTGVRLNLPQNREAVLRERRSSMNYSNFIRDAEQRGALNKKISDARKDLNKVRQDAQRAASTRSNIQGARYGEHLNSQWEKQIAQRKEILNNLLLQRKAV